MEGYALLQLAAHGEGAGAIVEIGSFMGRSTVFLASGSKSTGREKVFAVDHFKGSREHQFGQQFATPVLQTEGSTFGVFAANMRRLDLSDYVHPIQSSSVDAARAWRDPIRLVFIDGDHAYESVRQDYLLWSPYVAHRGYICFHDVGSAAEVTRFYEELLRGEKYLREVATVQSLKIVQKVHV
jgi:hypothetical protein